MFAKAYLAPGVSVVAMALFIGLSGVSYAQADTPPSAPAGMLETFTWPADGQAPGRLFRLSMFDGPDAWVFTYNAKEAVGLGYQTKLLGGPDIKWQRFIVNTEDLNHLTGFQTETLAIGRWGTTPYDLFLSLRMPTDKKPVLLMNPSLKVTDIGKSASLWAVGQHFDEWDKWALDDCQLGPELRWSYKGTTLRFLCLFGPDSSPSYQLWTFIPVGGGR